FLGLQVHQSPRGIFISQSQYVIELLKKHSLDECVSMSTPMATERLDANLQGTPTDQTTYLRMIGGLMYLTASRPDIAFATFNAIANVIPSQVDTSECSYMSGHFLHVHLAQSQTSSVPDQQYQLYLAMIADPQLQQQDIAIWLALQVKFERNTVLQTTCRTPAVRPKDQDDPHDDAHPEGENSAKRQKTSEYEAYVSGESSFG
ncbi:retrovirus-related pol polyprotein from transposon TNT 1-94, partial [Tanacetum coccineum]